MQYVEKNKRNGIIGTLLFHLLLLIALFFLALRTPLPLPGEEGVEVDLGYSNQGMGLIQPDEPAEAQQKPIPKPLPEEVKQIEKEEIITQSIEEAPALPKQEKPKPVEKPKTEPAKKTEPEVIEPPQPKVNQKALFKGSSTGTANAGSEGITGQPGDQGKPEGLRDVKRYEGQGGQGNGPSYSLGGRGAKYLASPSSNFVEQGDVVVDIWVDRKGKVVRAEVSVRGTTILDSNLRNLAVKAALNSVFAEDPQATTQQKGTITYTFIVRS